MTPEQFDRWKDFSLRMARTCFKKNRRPYWWEVVENVEGFFNDLTEECIEEIVDWDSKPYVCDMCAMDCEHWIPSYWSIPEPDEVPEAYENARNQWAGPVMCCIRAGLDLASAPSAGVVGFTVCDLRKMYPDGIPDWINSEFRRDGAPVDLNIGECNVPIWL